MKVYILIDEGVVRIPPSPPSLSLFLSVCLSVFLSVNTHCYSPLGRRRRKRETEFGVRPKLLIARLYVAVLQQ